MKPRLHVLVASTRPGRKGGAVGAWAADAAARHAGFDVERVDLADYALPVFDEAEYPEKQLYAHAHTKRWAAKVSEADAFVFVLPEYDYFPPASVVNAVQYLAKEWHYKPVGFVSYGGISGGLRSAQALKLLVTSVKMMPMWEGVSLPHFSTQIADGTFKADERQERAAATMLDELLRWTQAMRALRA